MRTAARTPQRSTAAAGRRGTTSALAALVGASLLLLAPSGARGDEPPPSAPVPEAAPGDGDSADAKAAALYDHGVALVEKGQYSPALADFESAAQLRPAALTTFNIGYCQRALGQYVAARGTFGALVASPGDLSPTALAKAKSYRDHLDTLVVRVDVHLDPPEAQLSVNGHPLRLVTDGDAQVAVVSDAASEPPMGKGKFTLLLDPGAHIFKAKRAGHEDADVRVSYKEGERKDLDLTLDLLPAIVRITSDPASAIVQVDGREAGLTPIDIARPSGSYRFDVLRDGFETYTVSLDLKAGQRADLNTTLLVYRQPLVQRWWFWATIGGIVATVVTTSVIATQRTSTPELDGGSLDWVVRPIAFMF